MLPRFIGTKLVFIPFCSKILGSASPSSPYPTTTSKDLFIAASAIGNL